MPSSTRESSEDGSSLSQTWSINATIKIITQLLWSQNAKRTENTFENSLEFVGQSKKMVIPGASSDGDFIGVIRVEHNLNPRTSINRAYALYFQKIIMEAKNSLIAWKSRNLTILKR